jgi:ankyrin repeat protein
VFIFVLYAFLLLFFQLLLIHQHGWTPLHIAATRGSLKKVMMLIKAGALLDMKDKVSLEFTPQPANSPTPTYRKVTLPFSERRGTI